MRPNKFRSEVTKAITYRLRTGSNARFTPYLIKAMSDEYKKLLIVEDDHRLGMDTYGYDNVEMDLFYISDRWCCGFRIRWLLDGLEQGVI